MTQTEKLALRLSQFPGRLVRVLLIVDNTGALISWVVEEDKKIEGALTPPPQYDCELQFTKKDVNHG